MRLNLGLGLNRPVWPGVQQSVVSDLLRQNQDVNVLIIGDDTSDATTEWPYLFFSKAHMPSHTIEYRAWNEGGGNYDAATVLSKGAGSKKLTIYNASVATARGAYWQGARFAAAIAAVSAHVIVFNIGYGSYGVGTVPLVQGELMSCVMQVHEAKPTARLMAIKQHPLRDATNMDLVVSAWNDIAANLPGMRLVDVHQKFLDLSKSGTLYASALLPNAAGQALYVEAFRAAWFGTPLAAATPWLDTTAASIFPEYNFGSWVTAPGVPPSWSEVPATLVEDKELTIKDTGESFSLSLIDAGAATFNRLSYVLSNGERDAIRGQTVSLWAKVWAPTGLPSSAGRLALAWGGAGALTMLSRAEAQGFAGWRYIGFMNVPVPADATTITISLYYDTGVPSVADKVYWARRIRFTIGATPKQVGVAE